MMRRDMERQRGDEPSKEKRGRETCIPLSRQQLVTRDPRLTVSWNRVCGYQTRLYYTNAHES